MFIFSIFKICLKWDLFKYLQMTKVKISGFFS